MAYAAIAYAASTIDTPPETYAHVAKTALEALTSYAEDVRAARQIRGGIAIKVG
jgi:3-methyl-2-oxobutanoate hydroxymethyltransferase